MWTPHQFLSYNQCLWLHLCSLGLFSLSSGHTNIPASLVILGWALLSSERLSPVRKGAGVGWWCRLCLYASIAEELSPVQSFPIILPWSLDLIKPASPRDHPMLALGDLPALALGQGDKHILGPGNTEASSGSGA